MLGGLPARPPPGRVVQDWVRGVRCAWGPSREGEPGRGGMEGWWPREGDTQQRGLERASATRGMVGSGRAAGGKPAGCHAGGWVPRSRVMLRIVVRHPSGNAASHGAADSQEILIYSHALGTWPHPAPTGLAGLRCWVISPCTTVRSQPGVPRGGVPRPGSSPSHPSPPLCADDVPPPPAPFAHRVVTLRSASVSSQYNLSSKEILGG